MTTYLGMTVQFNCDVCVISILLSEDFFFLAIK
jgi:hypothetical protein